MRLLAALVFITATGMAVAQQAPTASKEPYQIRVRHADPWAIKAMLEGQSIVSPEMSTLFAFFGMPQNTMQNVNSLITGGKLIVNPTDNSIWFFPDRS
jgi:hypothetical protein